MSTQRLNSQLDIGYDNCVLLRLDHKNIECSNFLAFSTDLKSKSNELYNLMHSYKLDIMSKKKNVHDQLITKNVAKWIHYTNKLEFSGLSSEGDTEALITGHRLSSNTVGEKEVLQMFKLLKFTYSDNEDLRHHLFDIIKLKEWHKILYDSVLDVSGQFRRCGVRSDPIKPGSEPHVYPHHSIMTRAVTKLCNMTHSLVNHITKSTDSGSPNHLLKTFALAAFTQFHFVDIHPFIDGNGRMCRFLSKYILDSVCPLPFPMFPDRNTYLETLVAGRSLAPEESPKPLLKLLLETACQSYQELMNTYTDYIPTLFITADTIPSLQEQLKELSEVSANNVITLTVAFSIMKEDDSKELMIGDTKVYLKRESEIKLDTL